MQTPTVLDPANTKRPDFSGKHIMVADDEPINIMITLKMLEARKATVSKASNGNEVLAMLHNGINPDLLLLDIKMPELDGFLTIEKIKEQYPHIPVLAFTASYIDEETDKLLVEKGFCGSLPKSFNPDDFYAKIKDVLNTNSI